MLKLTNRMTCLIMSVLIMVISCPITAGKIIYVDDDATGANDGSSWDNAYVYLQDALADANSAEKTVEIRVAKGIYKPDQGAYQTPGDRDATFRLTNGVTLIGGYAGLYDPDPNARDIQLYETIFSGDLNGDDIQVKVVEAADLEDFSNESTRAENSYHVVICDGTNDSIVLDGFTITAGNANGPMGPSYDPYKLKNGAGMYNISGNLTLTNCTFTKNSADGIGGMFNDNCCVALTNCTFTHNSQCGMCNVQSSLILTNCTFSENWAKFGGGICNDWPSVLKLTDCTFVRNSAELTGGGMDGGTASLTDCVFIGNEASEGGGIWSGSSTLTNCIFIANKARNWGGGMWSDISTIYNCMFNGNTAGICGGAIYIGLYSDLILTNCTLTDNLAQNGNALASDEFFRDPSYPSNVELTNCIVWGRSNEIWNDDGSSITISYSDIQGGQAGIYDPYSRVIWGQGNIDTDPLFAEPGYWVDVNDPNNDLWVNGDYHLKSEAGRWDPNTESWVIDDVTSPCIDAGDPLTPVMYEPHPRGCFINMGAYGGTEEASKSPFNSP